MALKSKKADRDDAERKSWIADATKRSVVESAVGIQLDELAAIYTLDSVRGFGPQKFKQVAKAGLAWTGVLDDPSILPFEKKTLEKLQRSVSEISSTDKAAAVDRAERQLDRASKLNARIISYAHPAYPRGVYASNNPIPVLYVRGTLDVLRAAKVLAAVGSRKIRPPYSDLHVLCTAEAVKKDFALVSGFALGADTLGHRAAHDAGGRTICCMPGGLDRPFPPENRALWEQFLSSSHAAFVSEFPFGTGASSLTLKKRNKLIVAFASGVLVSQSAREGGAMNAFRFALEQKKPVGTFSADGTSETTGNAQIASTSSVGQTTVFSVPTVADSRPTDLLADFNQWLSTLSSSTSTGLL